MEKTKMDKLVIALDVIAVALLCISVCRKKSISGMDLVAASMDGYVLGSLLNGQPKTDG